MDLKTATVVSTQSSPAAQVTRPLYSSDDDRATTETVTPKKKTLKQGSREKGKGGSQSEMCNSGSETTGSSSSDSLHGSSGNHNHNGKKSGVTNKCKSLSLIVRPATLET